MYIFMKIGQVGVEIFHEDGRTRNPTEMTKLMVSFRNCASAKKNSMWSQNVALKIDKLLLNYSESNQKRWIILLQLECHI
jgi:hypothetical protein